MITIKVTTPLQNDGLPTIVNAFEHSTALRLYAADLLTNHAKLEQYHPAATAGECVPCVYATAGIANAFFELLAQTATSGQDMPYQPQLKISSTGNALLFTHDEAAHKDCNAITRLIPEAMPFDELLCSIATAIEETGAKLVIIDDVQAYAKQTSRPIFWDLNELAYYQNAIILAGFKLTDGDEETSSYLATHAHNLWQLQSHSLNMLNDDGESSEQPYFCFSYGSNLEPKRAYFGLDSEGKACMPRDLIKLLRIQELARTFAPRWVKQSKFADICFGATAGEFNKDSFVKAVEIATLNGYIAKSGSGNHTKLMYADSPLSKTINAGSIAVTAVTNPYATATGKRQRKAILKHGEFKIVTAESGTSELEMQKFAQGMMGCILTGQKWLDFQVKTKYKNILAIAVTNATQRAKEWLMQGMGKDIATFNIQTIPTGTADGDFLTAYKGACNSMKPDFVFVIGLDRIQPTKYTWQLLLRELKTYSARKGICTLAFSGEPQEYFGFDISKDEHWTISPLVREDERTAIHNAHGIVLPPINLFQGYAGNLECQCRFGHGKQSKLVGVSTAEAKRAFLVGTFYWCNETDGHDIETDCTGHQLTNSVIWQAKREGIISLERYGKAMIDSKITFIRK